MGDKINKVKNKIAWDSKEVDNINNIIEAADIEPKSLHYNFDDNFVEFEGKKFDAISRHKLFDWFDVAKIIEILQLKDSQSHGKVKK